MSAFFWSDPTLSPVIHPTPAIVTQAAVRRLPRWALALLCMAYILPGYVGREPWKNEDVATFWVMSLMANDQADWWNPLILGVPADTQAWLPYWLGAGFIHLIPGFPEMASRLPFMAALALTLFFTWYAVYRFALLPAAQPVEFAFGGQAHPVDYARALADSGLMALLACLGLAQLSHETAASTFQMASFSMLLYSAACSVHSGSGQSHTRRAQYTGAVSWIAGLMCLGWSGQPVLAAFTSLSWPCLHHWIQRAKQPTQKPTPVYTWLIGAITSVPFALFTWQADKLYGIELPNSASDWYAFVQQMLWFAWPAWPLAIWTVWRWRNHLRQPHLATPLYFTIGAGIACLLLAGSDRALLMALPALAVLAAFALPTLKRSVSALIDWFSVLFFTSAAVVIWVIWVAMMTGVPSKPAANVARLAPGFQPEFGGLAFALATASTLIWLAVVAWRLGRHPTMIWKSMVLPATGGVLCWLLLMTLWLPLLDYGRSYGPISRRMSALIEPGECALIRDLSQAQIAGLMHHGQIELKRTMPESQPCRYLITRADNAQQQTAPGFDWAPWTLKARLNRLNDKRESLLLFTRNQPL